ncbi:MAG: VWA domain-containing protein [Pseudomonadales bacterium]
MTLAALIEAFHFLRPLWLLAIIPAGCLAYYFWHQKSSAVNWHGAIDENLLGYLIEERQSRISRWPWFMLFIAWLLAAVALAGPSWKKLPQPIHQRHDALVIILDLSLSMLAEDVKPSRLVRARHKVLDILATRNEGVTALIAYSGDAHIVSPLTDDNPTVANLTPALAPGMMPVFGSDPVAALKLAQRLFKNTGINNGRILLVTDNITDDDVDDIDNSIRRAGFELSILGVGTTDGAPIPAREGFLKDNNGNIIVPQLQRQPLEQLAKLNGGRYTDVSLNDDDIHFLLPTLPTELDDNIVLTDREFDQWHDRGPLLALILLPLTLLAFRRGWLLVLPLLFFIEPQSAYAFEWKDLWQRPDQQAANALQQGDPKSAAKYFQNQQWRGAANYQAGDFSSAEKSFSQSNTANAHYNRGNALAKAGKLDEAIAAYDKALQQQPEMEDAQFNKQLLEQLQQQEQQEQQQNQDQQSDQQDSEQQKDQQQNDQQSSDQNNSDAQSPPQQDQQSDSSDQQQQTQENKKQQQEKDQQEQSTQAEPMQTDADQQSEQQKQAMEQWLRKIPDDPSGLLRRKFDYEYRLRQQQGETQREQPQW